MINSPDFIPFENVDAVGVAIKSSPQGQNHIGIIYLDDGDAVKFLHFATQNTLLNELPSNRYYWLDLKGTFTKRDKVLIQVWIWDLVQNLGDQLPHVSFNYGFDDIEPAFDSSGHIIEGKENVAFTCASFVLNVFESLGYALLDYEDWPLNDADNNNWQMRILLWFFENSLISIDQFEKRSEKVGSRRFKPEEVAAATQLNQPASYSQLSPCVELILKKIMVGI